MAEVRVESLRGERVREGGRAVGRRAGRLFGRPVDHPVAFHDLLHLSGMDGGPNWEVVERAVRASFRHCLV